MTQSDSSYFEDSLFVKVFQGVGSIGAIFICPTYEARDLALLKKNQISAVLSAEKQEKISLPSSQIKAYLYLQIQDDINFNISQFFQTSFKFIEENRRLTNILIHCSSGLNCSIALVIAYLVKKYQYTYNEALKLIKKRHESFKINEFNNGFVHQLEYFAVQEGDFKLVKQNHMRRRIQRSRRTVDGIVRTYTNDLTTEQKLLGCQSPMKYLNDQTKQFLSLKTINSSLFPYDSLKRILHHNPEEDTTQLFQASSQDYVKHLPKKTDQQIEDEEHHLKIVSEILSLTQQNKIFQSKKFDSLRSDSSAMKNYDRLKNSKKKHLTFYSPLRKYDKYEMFTQNKLNLEFETILDSQV